MRLFGPSLSFRNYDWLLTVVIFVLSAIGLASIYSVDLSLGDELVFFPTQIIALVIGLVLSFVISGFHIVTYQSLSRLAYSLSFVLLVGVLIFGTTVRGTTGWFQVAGFSFQPAEVAKIALVLFLAWLIQRHGQRFDTWQFVFSSGLFTALLVGLIMLQPDLGSSLILVGIWFGLLLLTGVKKRFLFLIALLGLVTFLLSWTFLFADYQKDRLTTFLSLESDPLGAGYNVSQSIIAVGSGNLLGRGLGFGSQSQLHFLPEAQTDFIFSVLAEELGFVVVFTIFTIYFFVLWRFVKIARQSSDDFSTYVVLGIAIYLFIQIVINIGGAVGMLPVTGVTLPFLSYGGSSVIANFILLGIVQSAARSRPFTGHS